MNGKKATIAGLGLTALISGGIDASVLNEKALSRVEMIGEERVEAKQIGNVIETTFPWKDQAGLKVKVDLGEPTISERFKDKRKREVITEVVDFGDGGFKVDILLNEKPNTNVFCYAIEGAENYDFFYQPEITKEEIAEGVERPEDIVGSYAVYHKTLKNHVQGRENYATGKVMHIPRPQVWELNDEANTKEWAELSYNDREGLCVTARQAFLDAATYPVRIDPTFGYTSVGASNGSNFSGRIVGSYADAPEDGTVSQISVYSFSAGSTGSLAAGIYTDSATKPSALVAQDSGNVTFTSTATWRDINISASITDGTRYWLMVQDSGVGHRLHFDTGFSQQLAYTASLTFDSWPDPIGATTLQNNKASIYATYTASGGGGATTTEDIIWFFF